MFLAIIFVCFTATDCGFMTAPVVRSQSLCESVLKQRIAVLENEKEIVGYSAACIEIAKNKGEI